MKKAHVIFFLLLGLLLLPLGAAYAAESHSYTVNDWLNADNWDQYPGEAWDALLTENAPHELFVLAPKSDGAYSAALGSRFLDGFQEDPIGFADHLLDAPEEVRSCVLYLTFSIVHASERALLTEKASIQELTKNTSLTAAQSDMLLMCIDVIDTTLAHSDSHADSEATQGQQDRDKFPAFDPFGVNEMIDLHFELRNPDEEFFHTITQHFLSDPETFLTLIAELSPTQIRHLAKGIAYTIYKSDIDTSSLDVKTEDLEEIWTVFQYEIKNPENHTVDALKDFSPTAPTVPSTEATLPAPAAPPVEKHRTTFTPFVYIGILAVCALLIIWMTQKRRKQKNSLYE